MAITYSGNKFERRIVCGLGTEAAPTDGDDQAGVDLGELAYLSIHVESSPAVAFPAGATLLVYMYNSITGKWNQNPNIFFDLIPGLERQSFSYVDVRGRRGRLALIPNGAVPMIIDVYSTRWV